MFKTSPASLGSHLEEEQLKMHRVGERERDYNSFMNVRQT